MKKLGTILLSLVMLCVLSTTTVFAETVTQDDISVMLSTDKAEYTKDETIKATLTVTNNNTVAITNV